ncbi:hypothetical protein VPH35_066033 [Triticum aestivum]
MLMADWIQRGVGRIRRLATQGAQGGARAPWELSRKRRERRGCGYMRTLVDADERLQQDTWRTAATTALLRRISGVERLSCPLHQGQSPPTARHGPSPPRLRQDPTSTTPASRSIMVCTIN